MNISVGINEEVVVAVLDPSLSLTTTGVSTCICILVKGHVDDTPYIGMIHWDGFSVDFDKSAENAEDTAREKIDDVIFCLASAVLTEMKDYQEVPDDEKPPQLDAIYFIGGEHAVVGGVSGTELEVEALKSCARDSCQEYFETSNATMYYYDNYRTSGTNFLDLVFDVSGVEISLNDDGVCDRKFVPCQLDLKKSLFSSGLTTFSVIPEAESDDEEGVVVKKRKHV